MPIPLWCAARGWSDKRPTSHTFLVQNRFVTRIAFPLIVALAHQSSSVIMSLYLVAAPGKKLGGKRKRHEKKKYGLLPTVTRGSKKQKKKIYFQTVSRVEWLNYRNSLEVYFFFLGFRYPC